MDTYITAFKCTDKDTYITAFECSNMGANFSTYRSAIGHAQYCAYMDTNITTFKCANADTNETSYGDAIKHAKYCAFVYAFVDSFGSSLECPEHSAHNFTKCCTFVKSIVLTITSSIYHPFKCP